MFCSFIVPIYNTEKYLKKCIDSLLNQDIDDYEIILINDASKDDSGKIASKYSSENERVIFIDKPNNTGLSGTRNIGIEKANGEYIFFVDSDDYISPNILSNLKDKLYKSEIDIAYFGYYYEENNKSDLLYTYKNYVGICDSDVFMKKELLKRNLSIPACMACYRTEFIKKNGLFFKEGILHEDVRWSPIVLHKSKKIITLRTPVYHYLIRTQSISHKSNRKKNGIDLIETAKFLASYSKNIINKKTRIYFENYVCMTYLKAVAVNNVLYYEPESVDRKFPIQYARVPIDIIRSIIFMISPRLYCYIYIGIKVKVLKSRM